MNDAQLEATLATRASEHDCELVVEPIGNGLIRAALKTSWHPIDLDGAIRLSAANVDRHAALEGLYAAGDPR